MTKLKKSSILLTCLLLALLCGLLFYIDGNASKYIIRITRLCAINIVLALSMNLVNGFTGIFSLGHAGFMAIGAYTVALLTIPVAKKETIFMLEPLIAPLNTLTLPFGAALIIGGLLAAALAFLIGLPCLRLRGDYLAIATLGFSEIIRIVITNAQSLTNGAQGLKSIPATANIWWCYGAALATIVFIALLISSSYGRAFKAIREDEIAAESMGVSLLRHKMLSFMLSAFLAAVGGGLFASYIGTIGPDVFQVSRTYDRRHGRHGFYLRLGARSVHRHHRTGMAARAGRPAALPSLLAGKRRFRHAHGRLFGAAADYHSFLPQRPVRPQRGHMEFHRQASQDAQRPRQGGERT